jgi:hypothetical protein
MKHISPGIIVSKIVSPSSSVDINSALVVSGTAYFLDDVIFAKPNFTSSWAVNAVSSSYALTASYAMNGGGTPINTSSFATTGSNNFNGNQTITGSLIQGLEGNTATGEHSHAEGSITKATGDYSHAEGDFTEAIGNYSHAEGQNTMTLMSAQYSHAEGNNTIAAANHQHVQGQWNTTSSIPAAFIVGNGTDNLNRSNLIYAHDSVVEITGSISSTLGFTGSLLGTATFASTASYITASNVIGTVFSSSYSLTASYIDPTFISASAAAAGFGSGGGGGVSPSLAIAYAIALG